MNCPISLRKTPRLDKIQLIARQPSSRGSQTIGSQRLLRDREWPDINWKTASTTRLVRA
jgi:hypothetical protein